MASEEQCKTQRKIFVIGRNKTGTTSIGAALSTMGFRIGNQSRAELLMEDWAQRRFDRIVEYCKSADVFQDVPFGNDYTYQVMDYAFPGSKFILTIRNSAEEWYESLTRFHTRIVGKGRLPTADDLKQFPYNHVGWLWRTQQLVYGIDEHSLYDRELYIQHYTMHNRRVQDFFKCREKDLLILNLANPGSMRALCEFLDLPLVNKRMPHLNKSTNRTNK